MMRNKLGLLGTDEKDKYLILDLLTWMHQNKVDYTNTFCFLMNFKNQENNIYEDNNFSNWKKRWERRSLKNDSTKKKCIELMRNNNPLVVPRNHKVEEALNKANKGNLKPFNRLLEVLNKPYIEQEDITHYQVPSQLSEKYKTFCGT